MPGSDGAELTMIRIHSLTARLATLFAVLAA